MAEFSVFTDHLQERKNNELLSEAVPLNDAKKFFSSQQKKNALEVARTAFPDGVFRITLPTAIKIDESNINDSLTDADWESYNSIRNFLLNEKHPKRYHINTNTYVKGICFLFDPVKSIADWSNPTRIGKVLNALPDEIVEKPQRQRGGGYKTIKVKKHLDLFNNDPIRKGVGGKFYIVVSRHPYDLAGISTDRNWTSCMDLGTPRIVYTKKSAYPGSNYRKVYENIKHGALVAYLVSENEKTEDGKWKLRRPLGRILLQPNIGLETGAVAFNVGRVYGVDLRTGEGGQTFREIVKDWVINELNKYSPEDDSYYLPRELYNDAGVSFNLQQTTQPNDYFDENTVTRIINRHMNSKAEEENDPALKKQLQNFRIDDFVDFQDGEYERLDDIYFHYNHTIRIPFNEILIGKQYTFADALKQIVGDANDLNVIFETFNEDDYFREGARFEFFQKTGVDPNLENIQYLDKSKQNEFVISWSQEFRGLDRTVEKLQEALSSISIYLEFVCADILALSGQSPKIREKMAPCYYYLKYLNSIKTIRSYYTENNQKFTANVNVIRDICESFLKRFDEKGSLKINLMEVDVWSKLKSSSFISSVLSERGITDEQKIQRTIKYLSAQTLHGYNHVYEEMILYTKAAFNSCGNPDYEGKVYQRSYDTICFEEEYKSTKGAYATHLKLSRSDAERQFVFNTFLSAAKNYIIDKANEISQSLRIDDCQFLVVISLTREDNNDIFYDPSKGIEQFDQIVRIIALEFDNVLYAIGKTQNKTFYVTELILIDNKYEEPFRIVSTTSDKHELHKEVMYRKCQEIYDKARKHFFDNKSFYLNTINTNINMGNYVHDENQVLINSGYSNTHKILRDSSLENPIKIY